MKNITQAFRTLFKKGRRNGIKILSLGVGLALGVVLITKVYFEQTYDNFYPDIERIYQLSESFIMGDFNGGFPQVSGGVAPGMQAELPEVEAATRLDYMGDKVFYDEDKNKFNAIFIMADTSFYDVLPRPVIMGHVKDVLSRPLYAMVSEKVAKRINTDLSRVIGRTIVLDDNPGRIITIGGIFEDVPENTNLTYDIILSLASFSELYRFDCTMGWLGCDRFRAFAKLYPGIDPAHVEAGLRELQARNLDMEELKKAGVELWYTIDPLKTLHSSSPETRKMTVLLSLLASALIFTAVMNYVLIVISTMVGRTKEVAVNKCFGASGKDITWIVLAETLVHLILSLALAFFILLIFQSTVREILNTSLTALFTWRSSLLVAGVCILVFFIAGLLPSWLLTRIPIAAAFRTYRESKRLWKLALLFVQIIAAGFLITLLLIIARQYDRMINLEVGYQYERLLYTQLGGVDGNARSRAKEELLRLPQIEDITSGGELLLRGCSGNNVSLPGEDEELFNINDMRRMEANFIDMMEMKLLEGRKFRETGEDPNSILVSRSFVEKMAQVAGWTDGVLGKSVFITGQGEGNVLFTIVGVFENIVFDDVSSPDNQKPSVMFYAPTPQWIFYIKVKQITPKTLQQVTDALKTVIPEKDVVVNYYRSGMVDIYRDARLFRNSVLIGGLVTLLISLIGLIGYTQDEINRRSAEVAIRKINGATIVDIERLFLWDIFSISIPALILGGGIAYYAASTWQANFAVKTPLTFPVFFVAGLAVLIVILSVAALNCYQAATANPVDSLKKE